MTSIFKDFTKESDEEVSNRFVNTPTIEQLYEVDKKAVSDFLDNDKKAVKDKADEIAKKEPEDVSGVEALYLKVAGCVSYNPPKEVVGAEGLFGTVWSLIKRFFSMIGNFFKWLGETFFGFGKRSKTDLNKLQAKIRAGEINYDTELNYPANAKMLLNSRKFKAFPANLDWMREELDNSIKISKNIRETFNHAQLLFSKVQDKKVSINDVEKFSKDVASLLGITMVKTKKDNNEQGKVARLTGPVWGAVVFNETTHNTNFIIAPEKQTAVGDHKFKVSKSTYDDLATKLARTTEHLVELAELSKKESTLFNIKVKTEKDLEGMGKGEAYAMAAAFRTLVGYITFIKAVMSSVQQADTAAHDIMSKAFK